MVVRRHGHQRHPRRAYVDKTFNGNNWSLVREKTLRETKMNTREDTYAAIRKTLALLGDPFTR